MMPGPDEIIILHRTLESLGGPLTGENYCKRGPEVVRCSASAKEGTAECGEE